MDLIKLRKQLEIDEGVRLTVYLDHLGYPTVGIGHLLTNKDPELMQWKILTEKDPKAKLTISKERCDELFEEDIQIVLKDCCQVFLDFEKLAEEIKQIIANMMFNLGRTRFSKFKNFISAIKCNNYKEAAKQMIDSSWYNQVSLRAKRLVSRMETFANNYLCNVQKDT